jgi:hypothetical protein
MFRCLVPALVLAAACESFPTPAQLDHATVLAVIADPPIMAPGGTSHLTVVAADGNGPLTPTASWTIVPTYPGVPPMGTVTANADGSATYHAPDPVPTLPPKTLPADSVQVTVATDPAVIAVKLVGVASGVASANPRITDVTLGGVSIAGGSGSIGIRATADLVVVTDPVADEHWTFAWYSTVGEIKHYQSNPAPIVGADAAHDGWIHVVVRDGAGGAAVASMPVSVR